MMTDGITESRNKEGKQFGEFRLEEVLMSNEFNHSPIGKIKRRIYQLYKPNF